MKENILDLLYYEYSERNISFMDYEIPQSEEDFNEKYLRPLMKDNFEEGAEMEGMFSKALVERGLRDFRAGFMLGVYLTKEIFKA